MTETETPQHSRWTSRRSAVGRARAGIAGLMLSLVFAGCEGGAALGSGALDRSTDPRLVTLVKSVEIAERDDAAA